MPAQTPRYGFPYPVPGDPITDGAELIQDLAEAVEARIYAGAGDGGNGGGPAGPGIVGAYSPNSYSAQTVSGDTRAILATVNIPNPGTPYRLIPYAQFEAGHFNDAASKPAIYAVVGNINGTEIGRGIGSNRSDWNGVTVTPSGTRTFTGTQTVYFVLASEIAGRTVQASPFLASATVHVAAA